MTKATIPDSYLHQTTPEEQVLYNYLVEQVQTQPPDVAIAFFRKVLIEGETAANEAVQTALTTLGKTPGIAHNYKYILNRCLHILINRWQLHGPLQENIITLSAQFENIPIFAPHTSRHARRIRPLAQEFVKTEQFLTLKRLAKVIEKTQPQKKPEAKEDVGQLIRRYPYLYPHCLLSEDSDFEDQQTIRKIQNRIQHRFELDLSHYVAHQVRLAQLKKQNISGDRLKQIIQGAPGNPTLLTERELGSALKQFVGKVYKNYSYRDLSQLFLNRATTSQTYEIFKKQLYEYLTLNLDQSYGSLKFNKKLYDRLQTTLPHYNGKKTTDFLILRTASQLLNFLVVESRQRPEHYLFVDMISNLGPTDTVCLLLKVVLMCDKVKPQLEKRFSILFSHYEFCDRDGVPWLIKSLENLNVALSVHFGKADVSCLNNLMHSPPRNP